MENRHGRKDGVWPGGSAFVKCRKSACDRRNRTEFWAADAISQKWLVPASMIQNRIAGRFPVLVCIVTFVAVGCRYAADAATAIEQGSFPSSWITGGPNCLEIPDWQIHEYNPNLLYPSAIRLHSLRKALPLSLVRNKRALLIDTGAGAQRCCRRDAALIAKWLKRANRDSIALTVAHSHAHSDHTAGDKGFVGVVETVLIPAAVESARTGYSIQDWPTGIGSIDLGDRVIDVIPIPGHDPAHVAFYDRQTAILHTGDHLYPGRLYVRDFPAYIASTRRLVEFTASRPVAHIVGCHIEQSSTPFVDYPVGTRYQPQEHTLQLGRAHLLELLYGLEAMRESPKRVPFRDFTVWPLE